MLLVHFSILSRVKGGIKFEVVASDNVENIVQSMSVSLLFSGRKRSCCPFFEMKVVSHSAGYAMAVSHLTGLRRMAI
jgi:hypothetical protein